MTQDQLIRLIDCLFFACGLVISSLFIFSLGFLFLYFMLGA